MNRLFLLLFGMVTLVAHAQVPDYVPTEGLVGWYPLDGNALDLSSLSNDGSVHGATPTLDRNGNENGALNFDVNDWSWGSGGNWVYIPFHEEFNTESISISSWVQRLSGGYPNSTQGNSIAHRYENGYSNPSGQTWRLAILNGTADSHLRSVISQVDNSQFMIETSSSVEESTWTHVVMTWDGQFLKTYVNGQLSIEGESSDWTINTEGNSGVSLGMSVQANGHWGPLDGNLDDFGMWNRALSDEEITTLYNEQLPIAGCTDSTACNYNDEANEDDGTCTYPPFGLADCEAGGALCGEGTIWDASLQACVGFNDCPSDLDGDGIVGVNDLLSLLSDFGTECPPEVAEWTCGDPVSYHGYDYATVQIGDQCWLAENLRNAHYANGDVIPGQLSSAEWSSTTEGAQAVYDNETDNMNTYGLLYNWYAVSDARGLCPTDWHVPTDGEWMTLEMTLGMSESEANSYGVRGTDQGSQMKSSSSDAPSWDGTNTSGFSALAGGFRYSNGNFTYEGNSGYFWSSSPVGGNAWRRKLNSGNAAVDRNDYYQPAGFSVRCLKETE